MFQEKRIFHLRKYFEVCSIHFDADICIKFKCYALISMKILGQHHVRVVTDPGNIQIYGLKVPRPVFNWKNELGLKARRALEILNEGWKRMLIIYISCNWGTLEDGSQKLNRKNLGLWKTMHSKPVRFSLRTDLNFLQPYLLYALEEIRTQDI